MLSKCLPYGFALFFLLPKKAWAGHTRRLAIGRLDPELNPSVPVLNIPYASTHFAERVDVTPMDLLRPIASAPKRAKVYRFMPTLCIT